MPSASIDLHQLPLHVHAPRADLRHTDDETSPSKILASGRGCCRAAGGVALRLGANISNAACAHHCRLCRGRRKRYHRAADCPMADGTARPILRGRQPAGDGSNIGTEAVVNAPPDGYTLLLLVSAANAINASMFDKLNFNFIHDICAVGGLISVPSVILLHPSSQVRTVLELHRLCETERRQTEHGVRRHRDHNASGRRAAQDDDRHRHDSCPVPRHRSGDHEICWADRSR